MRAHLIGCGLLVAWVCSAAHAAARSRFGLAAGVVVPTYVRVGDATPSSQPGPIVMATFDWKIHPVLDAGVFVQVTSTTVDEEQVNAFSLGGSLHYQLEPGFGGLLRLGGGLGYRRLFADERRFDRVQGIAANVDAELSAEIAPGVTGLVELGAVSQPFGSNGDWQVLWAPAPYLALGMVF